MKTNALTATLITIGAAAVMVLLVGVRIDFSKIDTAFGWASAGALIAMLPLSYRGGRKTDSSL